MVLGQLAVPGDPKIWVIVGQGHTVLAFDAGEACLDIFPRLSFISSFSISFTSGNVSN